MSLPPPIERKRRLPHVLLPVYHVRGTIDEAVHNSIVPRDGRTVSGKSPTDLGEDQGVFIPEREARRGRATVGIARVESELSVAKYVRGQVHVLEVLDPGVSYDRPTVQDAVDRGLVVAPGFQGVDGGAIVVVDIEGDRDVPYVALGQRCVVAAESVAHQEVVGLNSNGCIPDGRKSDGGGGIHRGRARACAGNEPASESGDDAPIRNWRRGFRGKGRQAGGLIDIRGAEVLAPKHPQAISVRLPGSNVLVEVERRLGHHASVADALVECCRCTEGPQRKMRDVIDEAIRQLHATHGTGGTPNAIADRTNECQRSRAARIRKPRPIGVGVCRVPGDRHDLERSCRDAVRRARDDDRRRVG